MRWVLIILMLAPILVGVSVKKGVGGATAETSARFFSFDDTDIDGADAEWTGCQNSNSRVFGTLDAEACKTPAGMETRFLSAGACIVDSVANAISNCDIVIEVAGVEIASSKIELGAADSDETGECTDLSVITSPAWKAAGTEYRINVNAPAGGGCGANSSLSLVSYYINFERRRE